MASFFLTSSSSVARSLSSGETGMVAEGATLYSVSADAVRASGDFALSAMGNIVGDDSFDALNMNSAVDLARITVGAQGSLVSTLNSAITGATNNSLQVNNAGLILGGTSAIKVTAIAQTGVVADFHVANTGRIQSNSAVSSNNTINFSTPSGGLVDIANSGVILNGGAGGAIDVTGARLDLTNSGTIQCRSVANAIEAGVGNDVIDNTGTIIGGISLTDGSDTLTNHGSITGSILMGNGSDRLLNSGTITGVVNLGEGNPSGAISDTIINSGVIIGDVILGTGNDTYRNSGGRVGGTVFGGADDDTYYVDDSTLAIDDSSGIDTVFSSVDYVLSFGLETLKLTGNHGLVGTGTSEANTISGGLGDDTLRGGNGNDLVVDGGGDGNDVLGGGNGHDQLRVSGGDDVVYGGAGQDTLFALSQDSGAVIVNLTTGTGTVDDDRVLTLRSIEHVSGDFGNDRLTGSDGANLLLGAQGQDRLDGRPGADTLVGGIGSDTLIGGTGADVFEYRFHADSTAAARDVIADFTVNSDRIDLSDLSLPATPFVFLGTGAFTGTTREVRYFTDAGLGITVIQVQNLGSVVIDMEIQLTGVLTLTGNDFVL